MPRFIPTAMKWLRYGEEVGANGTPHLQGCVQFKQDEAGPKHFAKRIGDWAMKCHWEWMRGTIGQNVAYTGKDATEDNGKLHEFGTRPLSNKEKRARGAEATKERYKEILSLAKKGKFDVLENDYTGDYLRMKKTLDLIHAQEIGAAQPQSFDVLENWWIFGESGSGKSRAVRDLIPEDDLYLKLQNKWWDGYNGQKYVLIDDFDPNWAGKAALKGWCDHYKFRVEMKGGSMVINPKHFVITSNYRIDECEFRDNDIAPIKRRFVSVNAQAFRDKFKYEAEDRAA